MLYMFACEFGTREWRTHLSQQTSWDDVRYELEVKHHLHAKRWSRVCFFAMPFDDWIECKRKFMIEKSLRGVNVINTNLKVIIFRRPYPSTFIRHGAYTPPVFTPQPQLSEDELIAALGTVTTLRHPGDVRHPADYNYIDMHPVPDAAYVCNGCKKSGHHFRWDCPFNELTIRALDQVPRPHGIPKTFLRKVTDGERGLGAMRDEFGTFYMLKQGRPMNPLPSVVPPLVDVPLDTPTDVPADATTDVPTDTTTDTPPVEALSWHMDFVGVQYNSSGELLDPMQSWEPMETEEDVTDTLLVENVMKRQDEVEALRVQAFYAQNPGLRVKKSSTCIHWLQGLCVKGALQCEFLHMSTHMPICKFFSKNECTNSECLFRHVKSVKPVPCASFTEGFCPLGPRCPHLHVRRDVPNQADWKLAGCAAAQFTQVRRFLHV